MSRVRVATATHLGARQRNEDDLRHGLGPLGHFFVLADGAGGHANGAEASHRTVTCIARALGGPEARFEPGSLTLAIRSAHAELHQHQTGTHVAACMHSTAVVLWVDQAEQHALWSHVGDSRLYRFRHGRSDLLTVDDSVVQRMVQAGLLSVEQAHNHPQKNHLLAALGIEGDVEPHTVARAVRLLEGDAFLLCSDGWWDHFEAHELGDALSRVQTPEEWLADMQAQVLSRAGPQQDNFTAIAVWVGNPGEMTIARFEDTVPRGGR
jgi:serine/threonine protein phosphatase PrpC